MRRVPPATSSPRISPLCSRRWVDTGIDLKRLMQVPEFVHSVLQTCPVRRHRQGRAAKALLRDADRAGGRVGRGASQVSRQSTRRLVQRPDRPRERGCDPIPDEGFLRGDAVFDMTRSFNGKAFRVEEHVARLYRSLKYLDIHPGLSPAEIAAISEDVLERNRHLLGPGED